MLQKLELLKQNLSRRSADLYAVKYPGTVVNVGIGGTFFNRTEALKAGVMRDRLSLRATHNRKSSRKV